MKITTNKGNTFIFPELPGWTASHDAATATITLEGPVPDDETQRNVTATLKFKLYAYGANNKPDVFEGLGSCHVKLKGEKVKRKWVYDAATKKGDWHEQGFRPFRYNHLRDEGKVMLRLAEMARRL